MPRRIKARFIEPMLLLRTEALPDDASQWDYQLKLDGYRAVAFKTGGTLHLRSRNNNDFTLRYPAIVRGLAKLPDETVIDGQSPPGELLLSQSTARIRPGRVSRRNETR